MTSTRPKRLRLNMRIPAELLAWAKSYAVGRHTNVTQIFIDHLMSLRDQTNGHIGKRVESRRSASSRIQAGT